MAYQFLCGRDANLSKLGFGDFLHFDFDSERCLLRISIFHNDHYQDHFVVDLKDEFCLANLEVEIEDSEEIMED